MTSLTCQRDGFCVRDNGHDGECSPNRQADHGSPILNRFLYALAVLATLPAAPFALIGLFAFEGEVGGWFDAMGHGFVFVLFILAAPLVIVTWPIKWIATGKGWFD